VSLPRYARVTVSPVSPGAEGQCLRLPAKRKTRVACTGPVRHVHEFSRVARTYSCLIVGRVRSCDRAASARLPTRPHPWTASAFRCNCGPFAPPRPTKYYSGSRAGGTKPNHLCENRENESVTMAGAACRHGSSTYALERAPRRPRREFGAPMHRCSDALVHPRLQREA